MALTTGRRLGPYEILSPLGAGGMGEVYKARDTRLDRTVAIKILPDSLSGDPQFRERFDREARVISQLDHPNICALYDVGREGGTAYLVMQYLEGETLADTLTRGPLPLDQASTYAIQIADALARAHRSGIVHRDLKPGNVMVTKSGARLLDFGLAKTSPAIAPSGASLMTTPAALTVQGSILGTFQYMAPEQIEGGDADARADIWAFGCVLFEMITGSRAFSGKSNASLIANILQSQPPPLRQLQPLASPALDHIVRRCLEKDPEMRWQSIADVGRELRWVSTVQEDAPAPPHAARRRWILSGLAAALLVAGGAIAATAFRPAAAISERPQMKLTLLPPANLAFTPFGSSGTPHFALSPDGRHIAFVASAPGRAPSLWVRPLASRVVRELPGSEDAVSPFWSSNGQSIGFFAQGHLKTIALNGERPTTLARVTDPSGGAWSGDVILVGRGSGPLERIPATGGPASDATQLSSAAGGGHQWPQFLPDGRHFIFTERGSSVRLGVLDSTATTQLLDSGGTAVYADTGHLLFVDPPSFVERQRLMAQAVDQSWRPVGAARQIMDDVRSAPGSGFPPVSIAANGLLAYWDGTTVSTVWGWFDRQGNPLPAMPAPTNAAAVRIAQTDGRVAYSQNDGSGLAVWLMESTGGTSRLTFTRGGANTPIWSSDGREILFTSILDGVTAVFRQPASRLERERLIAKLPGSDGLLLGDLRLVDWSRDRQHALLSGTVGRDIALLSVDTGQIAPLIHTPATEIQARFSPDGRWIAYASDETGRWEVFVEPFPVSGAKSQVSRNGGSQPIWNGEEIYFLAPDGKLMAATVKIGTTFSNDPPRPLFQTRIRPTYPPYPVSYDVTSDGQRFLIRGARPDTGAVISVVANWSELLKQKP